MARRLLVRGRVQGVWFRDSCRRRAEALGVAGWVRNTESGDVEVMLEGEPDRVEEMIRWCRVGPDRAVVTSVEEAPRAPTGLTAFSITG